MANMGWLGRFLRWLSDLFWPGDYDREFASQAYKAYLGSKDVASLNIAIEHFQVAVEQYRKHPRLSPVTTLINYAVAVWRRYEDFGQSPTDLDTVIQLDTEARDSWSGEKNSTTYVFLLDALARACFEQYQRAIGPSPNKPEQKQDAFENAVKCYNELKINEAVPASQRITSQIQLGVIFQLQFELDKDPDKLDIGIGHLKEAKRRLDQEVNASNQPGLAKQSKKAGMDEIMATCLLNLASSYDLRYKLKENSDLTMAIDYNRKAKPFLEKFGRHELSAYLFNLGRLLNLRWQQTRSSEDYIAAKEMADAAKALTDNNTPLMEKIDDLLEVLQPEFRQGTRDSEEMGGPSQGTIHEASDSP